MKNIAVYTVIFNNYDELLPVREIGETTDYICFSNTELPETPPWQVRIIDLPHPDPRFASRYFFDQSTLVLPEYEYTIMHSGNAALNVLPETLLSYLDKTDIAAFRHPRRDNVYREARYIVKVGKDIWENIEEQIARYRSEGFPGCPLSTCAFLIRRNTPAIQEFEKQWWNEVVNGTHRDQVSFDYVRWKLDVKITYIPGKVFRSPIMRRHGGETHNLKYVVSARMQKEIDEYYKRQ
jgi:hypothetical protein